MKNIGIGVQELSKFHNEDLIYVDKTEIIHTLITTGQYYFLSRPRRFGKSLLVNTLKEIFSGNSSLFKETWIFNKWNWNQTYPVLKISFTEFNYDDLGLDKALELFLDRKAKEFNFTYQYSKTYPDKFLELIKYIGKEKPVCILIDEYDKPIIDYLENENYEKAEINRKLLKKFYAGIKDLDSFIRFLFVTGVSKFSQVSIFSDLNHLTDLTTNKQFSKIVGYTKNEIEKYYIKYLHRLSKEFGLSKQEILNKIRLWYDGYSWDGKNFLYNPFSILNLFFENEFKTYWFKSGTPTFLTKLIREMNIDVQQYDKLFTISSDSLDSFNIKNINLNVLLFQTGYLTIKEKIVDPDDLSISYKISYPNKEVKDSFYTFLISEFTGVDKSLFLELTNKLKKELENNNIDKFIIYLKSLYASIPYDIFIKERESYYHTIIYLILKMLNVEIICEQETNIGRIDAVVKTKKYIFIMEFKMGTAKEALQQIELNRYYEPYLTDKREIILLGVSFGKKEKNIKEYQILQIKNKEKNDLN